MCHSPNQSNILSHTYMSEQVRTLELRMVRFGSDFDRTEKNREPKWNRTEIQFRFGSVSDQTDF